MRSVWLILGLAACAGDSFPDAVERPAAYQPPPGVAGMELVGPPVALEGGSARWVARAPDLAVGDRVVLGWGGSEAPGVCPYRRLVGGHLCIDIAGPARVLQEVVAIADPDNPGSGMAVFDVTLPVTTRDRVFLQAISLKGLDSATSQVLEVSLPDLPPCPGTELTAPSTQAEVDSYRGCTELDQVVIVRNNLLTSVDLPVLTTVTGRVQFTSLGNVPHIDLPSLRSVGTTDSHSFLMFSSSSLTRFSAPLLETVTGDLRVSSNSVMTELNFDSLRSTGPIFMIQQDNALTHISLPNLRSAGQLSIRDMGRLDSVSVPRLESAGFEFRDNTFGGDAVSIPMSDSTSADIFIDSNTGAFRMDFPELIDAGSIDVQDNPGLLELSMPTMQTATVAGVQRNDALTSLDLGTLQTIANGFVISDHPVLDTVDLDALSSVTLTMRLENNPSWCVDPATDWNAIGQGSVIIAGNLCNP